MKKKLIAYALMIAMLMPNAKAFADSDTYTSEGFGKGDYSYEDGMYLPALHYFGVTKGRQAHPFGESKVGKISKEEKLEILARPKVKKLIKAYNSFYQTIIKWYKYGDKRIARWKEVKNMTDPVFGKLNKEQFLKIYTTGANTLQKVRDYFDYMGLVESDYTYQETLKMIDRPELSFENIISCGEGDDINYNQGISSPKLDAQSKELADKNLVDLVEKTLQGIGGYKIEAPVEILGKSDKGAYDERLFIETYLVNDKSQILFQVAGKGSKVLNDYRLPDKKKSKINGQDVILSAYTGGNLYRAEFKILDNDYVIETKNLSEDDFLWTVKKIMDNIVNISALSSVKLDF